MKVNIIRDGKLRIQLTPQTADLVQRYAEVDECGYISKYQIINEELIEALHTAADTLKSGLIVGEQMSKWWSIDTPCKECPDANGCNITCRRKHSFDKDVYGGLLCGLKPAIYIYPTLNIPKTMTPQEYDEWFATPRSEEPSDESILRVRVAEGGILEIERHGKRAQGAIHHSKFLPLVIDRREITLRPWSMALYRTFINRPEGIILSSLCGNNKRDLLRHYERASASPSKTAKLKELLHEGSKAQHLINNKISELNSELRAQGVGEEFMVCSEQYKANNKPYYIRYLKEQITK